MKQVIIPITCMLLHHPCRMRRAKRRSSALKSTQPLICPDDGTTPILAKFPRRLSRIVSITRGSHEHMVGAGGKKPVVIVGAIRNRSTEHIRNSYIC